MPPPRRPYHRIAEEQRRESLIAAAIDLIAEGGPARATVRAIAARAGVTPGLIRHYFDSKDDLTRAAFAAVMDRMTQDSIRAASEADPATAIATIVVASLHPPVMDADRVRLWAGFLQMVQQDPLMRDVHEKSYLRYRDVLQGLIAALPGTTGPDQARQLAIACNAVIDGLWLEGGVLPDGFAPGEVAQIGLSAVSAILGLPLLPAPLPPNESEVP